MDQQKTGRDFAAEDIQSVYKEFNSTSSGLTSQQATDLLTKVGTNTIQKAQRESQFKIFIKNFISLMAILLWVSGFVAIVAGTTELGIAIWCVNIINGCFSFYQQRAAQKATDSLLKMLPSYTRVFRDGDPQQIETSQMVPGDVFTLQAGDSVPTDARIIEATSLQVDESALTGESVPESKTAKYSKGEGQFAESNIIYAGTNVGSGTATAITVATGMNTEFGRIAKLTHSQKRATSPLQLELNRLTKQISMIAIAIGVAFFLAAIFFVKYPVAQSFIFALGMIVAFIPEGLLPTVTLSLARGVQRMAKKHAIVKDLNSIETLGETTVICSDKTGTLTQNQMTIDHVWLARKAYEVTGKGYYNNGKIQYQGQDVDLNKESDLDLLIRVAALDNDTEVQNVGGKAKILGTPTEASLIILSQKAGVDLKANRQKFPRLKEFPFDSDRKRMSTIHRIDDTELRLCLKGSLSDTLKLCSFILDNGQVRPLTAEDHQKISDVNKGYAAQGLRSMAIAYRDLDSSLTAEQIDQLSIDKTEQQLIFIGLTAMSDPPREEVFDAVKKCHAANIKIIMVTGDSTLTAKSIATQIGLVGDKARVITGTELDEMSNQELSDALAGEVIFARVAPEQKYKIVSTLQDRGEIVASTGDGVNDAPALKKADIGVAMGKMGTDVAKDAADMILTDDNFASIVSAIEEGRAVYSNIQKFLIYILTSNVPEATPSILFLFSRGLIPLPLTVMQILTVDLGTDLIPAIGLGSEQAEPGIMNQPPRRRDAHLLNKTVIWKAFAWYGLIASVISTFAYFFTNMQNGWPSVALFSSGYNYREATTMTLAAIVFTQIAAVMNCRTQKASVFKNGLFSNHLIWFGIVFEVALLAVLVYTPFLQDLFNTAPLNARDWLFLIAIPIPLFLIEELRKYVARRMAADPLS
ncbi:cation-translocating P-type ATPase [Lapidilactobacillus mulanensis]|uniref:Cation-translocating P-type ATPase n=1 Tax=Lapidilactobacillus mulanensis TaxID=2485999 RepID=A0ABW4DLG6_9LACO|nr:cation-transporting P-type ATPase [Lapidilactobacillus mulanensis]